MKKNYKNKEQKDKNFVPARVHILLAKESTKALIIRRLPSKKTCTILWDRKDNTFKPGECVHRIYVSDISPDGDYFYYSASIKDRFWSGISETPNIRAMLLYQNNNWFRYRTRFSTPRTKPHIEKLYKYFTQSNYYDPNLFFPNFLGKYVKKESVDTSGITSYRLKLIREGWCIIGHFKENIEKNYYRTLFEKPIVGNLVLQKTTFNLPYPHGKNGGSWDEHKIINMQLKVEENFSLWDWADVSNGFLYWTEKGILYSLRVCDISSNEISLKKAEELCDLNTFYVPYKKSHYSINGDEPFQYARMLEEDNSTNEELIEQLYLESIDNGGIDACFYLAELYEKQKISSTKVEKYIKMGFDRAKEENNLLFWHHMTYGKILYYNAKYSEALEIFTESLHYTKENKNVEKVYNYFDAIHKKVKFQKDTLRDM